MSQVVSDALDEAVKRVSKVKKLDWKAPGLQGDRWDAVSRIMLKIFDGMKGDGVKKPLAALQELAFKKSLKFDALKDKSSRPLHSVALWLTDTRGWTEVFVNNKDNYLAREILTTRGLLKKKG